MNESPLAWRHDNLGRLLDAASRLFLREKHVFVNARGFEGVTERQLELILYLRTAEMRPTELARQVGLGKSSMSELADRALRAGLLRRRTDPTDSRALFIVLTPLGTRVLASAEAAISHCEQRLASLLGETVCHDLVDALSAWLASSQRARAGTSGPSHASGSRPSIGRLLALCSREFGFDVVRLVREEGREDVTVSLLTLFRHLDLNGSRLSVLAKRGGMTKQSMREIVARAASKGLVESGPDLHDARARQVRFTAQGLLLLTRFGSAVASAEQDVTRMLNAKRVVLLKAALRLYTESPKAAHHGLSLVVKGSV